MTAAAKKSVRQYAIEHRLSITAVYLRLWSGRLATVKTDGRWTIFDRSTTSADTEREDGGGGTE